MSKDIATSRPLQARALADHLNGMLSVVSQRYLDPQCTCLCAGSIGRVQSGG